MGTILSSLATSQVVVRTICGATSDDKFGNITILDFHYHSRAYLDGGDEKIDFVFWNLGGVKVICEHWYHILLVLNVDCDRHHRRAGIGGGIVGRHEQRVSRHLFVVQRVHGTDLTIRLADWKVPMGYSVFNKMSCTTLRHICIHDM